MDRRGFIKRSIAGGLAALVGLPEGKAKAAKKLPLGKVHDWTGGMQGPAPAMTIRHTGKFRLHRETIDVTAMCEKGRTYKHGAMFVEIQGLCVTADEWSNLHGDRPVRLELKSTDYDLTAVGFFYSAVVTGWKNGPPPNSPVAYAGDFTFRLIMPIEEVVVKKQFPAERDSYRPFGPGDVVTHNGREYVKI